MSRLTPGEPDEAIAPSIVDAEWTDVAGDKHHAPLDERSSEAKRSKSDRPLWLWSVVAAFSIIIVIKGCDGSNKPDARTDYAMTNGSGSEIPSLSQEWLTGNWVMARRGGEDGQTSCGDFNAPALYKLNHKTAKLMAFDGDGKFRSLFAYTTPSGDEHTAAEAAIWATDGSAVSYENDTMSDGPFGGAGKIEPSQAKAESANVLTLDETRYVRCTGDVDVILGKPSGGQPADQTQAVATPSSDPPTDRQIDYSRLCATQQTVNDLRQPLKSAVTQVLGTAGSGDLQAGLWMLSVWSNEPKYRLLNISKGEVQTGTEDAVTVECRADLRLLVPMNSTNGAFSRYLQFNRASYKIRIKDAGSDNPRVYLLVEIQPVAGRWDVSTGTE